MRHLRFAVLGLLVVGVLVAGPKGATGTTAGYPDSIASLGDSITRAANPGPLLLGDQPQLSWSTGADVAVQSHYYRILQKNSLISGNNFNDAVSGARMTHLNSQASSAVSQGADYVTILMGANDVCTSSEATMTPVNTFRTQFQTALNTLTAGLPNADIFVLSIPDIYHLWAILKDEPAAVSRWSTFSICQSMLANATSVAQTDVDRRAQVRQRNIDFNTVLSDECALRTNCRFDNNAVFNTQFLASDVSTLDYFHPSTAGQAKLAAGTWDSDGDGVVDGADNCPAWPNPTQALPPWPVPPGDSDCDGFDTANENFTGTLPLVRCMGTATANDEGPPDAWPFDHDDNQRAALGDVLGYIPVFNSFAPNPPYNPRFDLNASGGITLADVLSYIPVFNLTCTP